MLRQLRNPQMKKWSNPPNRMKLLPWKKTEKTRLKRILMSSPSPNPNNLNSPKSPTSQNNPRKMHLKRNLKRQHQQQLQIHLRRTPILHRTPIRHLAWVVDRLFLESVASAVRPRIALQTGMRRTMEPRPPTIPVHLRRGDVGARMPVVDDGRGIAGHGM